MSSPGNQKKSESRSERLHRWWRGIRLGLAAVALLALTTFFLSYPLLSPRPVLEEGDVASQDIRSPRRVTYESAIRTSEERQRAEQVVSPVYTDPDHDLGREQWTRALQVFRFIDSVRADTFANPRQRRAWILAVPEFSQLSPADADLILELEEESWNRVQFEVTNILSEIMPRGVREGYEEQARQQVDSLLGLDLSLEEGQATAMLARQFIVVNSFYDEAETQAARERAREEVFPVVLTIEANEVIVREGQRVTALDMEKLQQLGLQQSRTKWSDVVGNGALALVQVLLLGMFLARFQSSVLWEGRKLLLLLLLMALFLLLARIMIPDRTMLRYLFPGPALAMLATATLGPHAGVATSIVLGSGVGLIGNSLELATYVTLGGLVASLLLHRMERLGTLFRAAMLVGLAHIAILLAFRLPFDQAEIVPLETALQLLTAFVNGVLSASMALGGLFLVGPLFDIITTFRLIELSRPDHPLLQRILREAPGTYHHSLMVASLAEQAAERIGADVLLTRVGAYYHDVGKIARPYFFIENQLGGVNPHERLDPYTSVEIITGHVRDGVELARRYRLPSRVRNFIPEHHGTKHVSFQYERAVELASDPQLVDETAFQHRGPRPQSRETALVMLADASEAVVRARRPASPEELAGIIKEVFDHVIEAGQLDECPITMHELRLARESFTATLKGVFHPRIRYPKSAKAAEQEPERQEQQEQQEVGWEPASPAREHAPETFA